MGTVFQDTKASINSAERQNNWNQEKQINSKSQGRGSGWRNHGRGRGRFAAQGKQCTYCHKPNHTVDECYSKHGYPPWYKKQDLSGNTTNSDRRSDQVCNLSTKTSSQNNPEFETNQDSKQDGNPFTHKQVQKLLSLLQESSGHSVNQIRSHTGQITKEELQSGKFSWILDTGAIDHVTFDKSQFISFYKIKPVCIKMPNNSHGLATHAGTAKFIEHLMLFNVLYIPEFSFNPISVQRLIGDLDCELIFSYKSCHIQDRGTSKMIGRAELNKDLYYLQHFSCDYNQVFVNNVLQYKELDLDMWHFRLGHPSNRILNILCKKFPYIRADSKHICDVCHFAKQRKLPYQLSNSSTATAFSLIHVDI